MARTFYLLREDEFAVALESTYGVSPGSPAAGDFFKHTSTHAGIGHELEELYRDRDRDNGQASVKTLQTGRAKSPVKLEADVIPAGVTGAPTEPDTKNLWLGILGKKQVCTAHTTTAAGSSGVTLNLAVGGGAASGINVAGGDIIGVDVDGTNGIECRQVASRSGDVVTLAAALSANPVAARNVYTGVTYLLDQSQLRSFHLWLFNGALKYKVPGVILNDLAMGISFSDGVPMLHAAWSGEGQPEAAQTETRPTPTAQGVPLAGVIGKVWIGAVAYVVVGMNLHINNGLELRSHESNALYPTGVKRTGNNSRYIVEQTLELYETTGGGTGEDTQALYDGGKVAGRTSRDTTVQIGNTVGNIVAWRTRNWKPKFERSEQNGERGLTASGRALATSNDDEIAVAFL